MRAREAVTRVLSLTIEKRSRAMQVKGNITCAQLVGTPTSAQWNHMVLEAFERPPAGFAARDGWKDTAGILGSRLRISWAEWLSLLKQNPLSGWRLVIDDFSGGEIITQSRLSLPPISIPALQSHLCSDSGQTSPKHRPTIMAKIQVCNVIRNLCNTALQLGGAGRPDQ
jgi:hypothetical protein